MAANEASIVLTRESAARISATVRRVEKMPTMGRPGPSNQRPIVPTMIFVVTTQISAATGQLSPGFGYGTMLFFNEATGTLNAPTEAMFKNIKIWSLSDYPIAVGSSVQCNAAYGQWWYCVTMCGNGVVTS